MLYCSSDSPTVIVFPESQTVTSGSQFVLSCNATGDPIPYIRWRRNGRVYNSSENINITSKSIDMLDLVVSSIRVSSVTPDDVGVYECVAINVLGVVSNNITVTLTGTVNVYAYITSAYIHITKPFKILLIKALLTFTYIIKYQS